MTRVARRAEPPLHRRVDAALEEVSRGVAGVQAEQLRQRCRARGLQPRVRAGGPRPPRSATTSCGRCWAPSGRCSRPSSPARPPRPSATPGSSRPQRTFADQPSAMFEVLLAADANADSPPRTRLLRRRRRARVRGGRHRPPHLGRRAGRHRAVPGHAARRHRGDGGDPAPGARHGDRRPPRPPPAADPGRRGPAGAPDRRAARRARRPRRPRRREARGEARHQPAPRAADPRGARASRCSTRAGT